MNNREFNEIILYFFVPVNTINDYGDSNAALFVFYLHQIIVCETHFL